MLWFHHEGLWSVVQSISAFGLLIQNYRDIIPNSVYFPFCFTIEKVIWLFSPLAKMVPSWPSFHELIFLPECFSQMISNSFFFLIWM